MSTQHAPFCKCSDPNCPAVAMMRKISAMPTNGDVWSIETVAGFTMDRSRKRKASHARDLGEMEKRVEAQFATLIANGIRHVVLSAFGCGAFENDPSEIAWVYKQAVERHRAAFAVIAFAIFYAGHGEDNYKIFKAFLAPED